MIGLVWLGLALLIRSFRLKRRVQLRHRKLKLRRKINKDKLTKQKEGTVSAAE